MASAVRAIVIGNWKMNGVASALKELEGIAAEVGAAALGCDVMICPPATLISRAAMAAKGSAVAIGGQDCHWNAAGAHTGDVSAEMIADCGGTAVIVGHSERRTDHAETDEIVQKKAAAALRAGLTAIVCVGETLAERKAGRTLDVVSRQVKGSLPAGATAKNTILAYEPVWAIGTGLTPTTVEVAEVHGHIRDLLKDFVRSEGEGMRILYGGSVKPSNASELMAVANVNGALVGGASLKTADFMGILKAYM